MTFPKSQAEELKDDLGDRRLNAGIAGFLIEECPSAKLADLARERGHRGTHQAARPPLPAESIHHSAR
jgi:hypothetical protein